MAGPNGRDSVRQGICGEDSTVSQLASVEIFGCPSDVYRDLGQMPSPQTLASGVFWEEVQQLFRCNLDRRFLMYFLKITLCTDRVMKYTGLTHSVRYSFTPFFSAVASTVSRPWDL